MNNRGFYSIMPVPCSLGVVKLPVVTMILHISDGNGREIMIFNGIEKNVYRFQWHIANFLLAVWVGSQRGSDF
jgi:hypothetical protein